MKYLTAIWDFISLHIVSKITWNWLKALFNNGRYYEITDAELNQIREILRVTNCIGLSHRKTHLTTYLIAFGSWLVTGKKSYWTHAFMNLEGEVNGDEDFLLVEATGPGVHTSKFMEVFDCDSVCLLIPKNFTMEDWADVVAKVPSEYGKKYDTLFQYKDESKVSCIELIRILLKATTDYFSDFAHFEYKIEKEKQLTPQMLYDCPDFKKIYLVIH